MTTGTDRAVEKPSPVEPPVRRSRGWVSPLIVWANVVLALVVIAPSFFSGFGNATGTTAQFGAVLLVLVLLPSNLLRFGWLSKRPWLRGLARLRKPLGISSGVWFVAHSLVALVEYFELDGSLLRQLFIGDMALGVVATGIFVALLATSTNAAQRILGANWKRLQRLVWFAVPLALAHAALSSLRLNHLEPPGVVLFGGIIVFAIVEYVVLRHRRGAWTHAGLVTAGVMVAALIYSASWLSVGPWTPTNDEPQPPGMEAAPPESR